MWNLGLARQRTLHERDSDPGWRPRKWGFPAEKRRYGTNEGAGGRRLASAGSHDLDLALGNSTLQLAASPEMRGRVMALWAVVFLGSTPIGGPIVGWVGRYRQDHIAKHDPIRSFDAVPP
jgi:hypothetical protein